MKPQEVKRLLEQQQSEYDTLEDRAQAALERDDWSEVSKLDARKNFLLGQLSILRRLPTK